MTGQDRTGQAAEEGIIALCGFFLCLARHSSTQSRLFGSSPTLVTHPSHPVTPLLDLVFPFCYIRCLLQ